MPINKDFGIETPGMLDVQLKEKTERQASLESKKTEYYNILNIKDPIGKGNALTRLAEKVGNFFVTISIKFELIFIERSLKSLGEDIKYLREQGALLESEQNQSSSVRGESFTSLQFPKNLPEKNDYNQNNDSSNKINLSAVTKEHRAANRMATLSSEYKEKNLDEVKDLIRTNPMGLNSAPDRIKNDRDFVLELVKKDGNCLQYASEELQDDEEIVRAAMKTYPRAIDFATEGVRKLIWKSNSGSEF